MAGEGGGDFAVLVELAAVRESWLRRVSTAQGECGSLAVKLRAVAREQGATDQEVRAGFGRLVDIPAQTPPLPPLLAQAPLTQLSSLYLLGGGDAGGGEAGGSGIGGSDR
ncbi:hypothetical protein ACWCPT_28325 [Streptomyces sp. NPDC002308]